MRAITPVFSVLLIIVLSVAVVGFLWLFFTGTFNSLTSTGTSTVGESLTTISSCMKIESVYGNQVSIRNCGKGVIPQDSLKVYLDNVPLDTSMAGKHEFGKDDIGAGGPDEQGRHDPNYKFASRFQAPVDGAINQISLYVYALTGAPAVAKFFVYSDNNGSPDMLLGTSNEITIPGDDTYAWRSGSLNVNIEAKKYYWIGAIIGGNTIQRKYDNGSPSQSNFNYDVYSDGASDTWGGNNFENIVYSIYATYTSASMPVINEGETGTVTLSGLWNFNPGGHLLRVTNPKVITEREVEAVLSEQSPVLDLDFDEGDGRIAYDSSGNENNGILNPVTSLVFAANNGDPPWGFKQYIPSTADWIWKYADAASSAPPESFEVIRKFVLSTPTTVRLNISVDDDVDAYIDDIFLGSEDEWEVTNSWSTSLSAGTHYLKLKVGNSGYGPAGLIASLETFETPEGSVLFITQEDGTWTTSGPTWVDGEFGKALQFDGIDDFANITNDFENVFNSFTIDFWVYPTATHEIDTESNSGYDGVSGQKYAIFPTNADDLGLDNNHACVGLSIGTNGVSVYEHAADYMPALLVWEGTLNGWTHITLVYDDRVPKLYINGNLVRTGLTSTKSYVHPSPNNYFEDGIGGGYWGYFNGAIDSLKIYDKVLTPGETGGISLKLVSYD